MISKTLCLALIAMGLAVSGYLLARHIAIDAAHDGHDEDPCSAMLGAGCDSALSSPLAVWMGIPLAGWEIVYLGTLTTLLMVGWGIGPRFESDTLVVGLGLAGLSGLASLGLGAMVGGGHAPFCPLCAVLHGVNLALLPTLAWQLRCSPRHWARTAAVVASNLFRGSDSDEFLPRWKVVGFLAPALGAIVLYQWVLIETDFAHRGLEEPLDAAEVIADFDAGRRHSIEVTSDDAWLGSRDAPARLVVFSDFECPGCRAFARRLPRLLDRYDGKLQIVFKHLPLDTDCNESIKRNLHPHACEAACAAEAARRQGQFWEAHDRLFASSSSSRGPDIVAIAGQLELDTRIFEADRLSDATRRKIRADIEQGLRLGVDVTPAVFLNGRRVADIQPQALEIVIEHLTRQRQVPPNAARPMARN